MISLPNQTALFESIHYVIDLIVKRCKCFSCLFILLASKGIQAQTNVGTITTTSLSCSTTIAACEGDTLTLIPQNRPNYTNYKWYLGSVTPENQITPTTASASNVIANNFVSQFPSIQVVSNGGIYILTSEYSTVINCMTINDTITLNFSKRPIVQASVDRNVVCVGGRVTLNAILLAGSG